MLALLREGMSISKPSFLERWTLPLTPQEVTGHTRWLKLGATCCHHWHCVVHEEHLYQGVTAGYHDWGEGISCRRWLNLARGHQCLGKLHWSNSLPGRVCWSPLAPSPMKYGNGDACPPPGIVTKTTWDNVRNLLQSGPTINVSSLATLLLLSV